MNHLVSQQLFKLTDLYHRFYKGHYISTNKKYHCIKMSFFFFNTMCILSALLEAWQRTGLQVRNKLDCSSND